MERDGTGSGSDALDEITGDDSERVTDPDGEPTQESAPPIVFTRGMNTRATVAWLKAEHGPDGVERVKSALPDSVVEALGGSALRPPSTSWVPFMAHAKLLQAIADVHYEGDREALVAVGRATVLRDLPRVMRPFARMLSPGFLISMTTKLWNLYHTHGAWEISPGHRELVAVLVDRPEAHPAFCAATRGMTEAAMIMAGALDVHCVEEKCAARGAPCCSLRVSWHEKSDGARARVPRPPS